ncbi:hypothetical protein [Metabacillus sp. 84]|uniref:hypothetical protein n=1 Tax=unclassified Metabacillus TaxID=2675274 RepID=UPI003CF5F46C
MKNPRVSCKAFRGIFVKMARDGSGRCQSGIEQRNGKDPALEKRQASPLDSEQSGEGISENSQI